VSLKISVIGLGYLGATTAIAFAKMGHEVIGIDPDEHKVQALRNGKFRFTNQVCLRRWLRSRNLAD